MMTLFVSALLLAPSAIGQSAGPVSAPDEASVADCLVKVKEIHGGTGPWAVAGYRIGKRALADLELPRRSFAVEVVHRCPALVQYSCVADGLQAATGASPGKLNLKVEEVALDRLGTTVVDRKSGRRLDFTLRPDFVRSITDLPPDRLEAEGRRVAALPDGAIFEVVEVKSNPGK